MFSLLSLNTSEAGSGEGVFPIGTNSVTPVVCSTVQFNSDTIHPDLGSSCAGKGLGCTRPPLLQTPGPGQLVTCASEPLAISQKFPRLPTWVPFIL